MPTVVTVTRGTKNANTEDVRIREVAPLIAELEGDEAQLATMLMQIQGAAKKIANPKFEWIENDELPREDKLGGSLTAGATTMTVQNFAYFRKNDVVLINGKEQVLVGTTPTTNSVTITRGYGTTAGTAASANDILQILGDANEEGSAKRGLLTVQKAVVHNLAQSMRTPFGLTGVAIDSSFYGGDDWAYQKRKAGVEHKRKADRAFFHQERYEDTSGTQYRHVTGGLIWFIAQNGFVKDAGGDLTEPELEDDMRVGFRFGSNDKVAFCSPKAITVIHTFGRDKVEIRPEDKKYGVSFGTYKNASRNIKMVEHKQFTHDDLDDLSSLAGYIVILDMQMVKLHYMGEAMVRYVERIGLKTDGTDGDEGEFISRWGVSLMNPKKHMLIKGVQA